MTTAVIETHKVNKSYKTVRALRDCSLRVDSGAVVALVGPNGAGKSTLLGLLTGLVEPTTGEVRAFGEPVSGAVRERIAFTAQGHPLYRQFTVADMLTAGRRLNTRWDDSDARRRLTELDIPTNRKIGKLSGGQQAQVSLALALAKQPDLLLLDEPVAALDPLARREFMQNLMAVAAEREITVVLSSHIVSELERVCDHLIALNYGHVQLAGPVEDLLAAHLVIVGPTDAAKVLERTHTVVSRSDVGRQTTALIRPGTRALDPVWRTEAIGLEELVLTYLSRPETGALPGPTGVIAEVTR